jgi:hypothetical protein
MSEPSETRIVEAERFIMKDANGRTRAELAMLDGEPRLTLCDSEQRTRLALTCDSEGSSIALHDASASDLTGVSCTR